MKYIYKWNWIYINICYINKINYINSGLFKEAFVNC